MNPVEVTHPQPHSQPRVRKYDRHTPRTKSLATEDLRRLNRGRDAWVIATAAAADQAGLVTSHAQGLHGYIGFSHDRPPAGSGYSAGMGFYAAVWPLIDQPLADFPDRPAEFVGHAGQLRQQGQTARPEGTLARTWKERGPTWASVFQTLEGGLGYWAGNHFRYGPRSSA